MRDSTRATRRSTRGPTRATSTRFSTSRGPSIVGDYGSNVVRFGTIREELGSGNRAFFRRQHRLHRFGRTEPIRGRRGERASELPHRHGRRGAGITSVRSYSIDDTYSYFKPDWGGDHNFKVGGGVSWNRLDPAHRGELRVLRLRAGRALQSGGPLDLSSAVRHRGLGHQPVPQRLPDLQLRQAGATSSSRTSGRSTRS